MNAPTVEQRVHALISQELGLGPDEMHSDARLTTDLGATSLDSYSLVLALEDEFAIEIPDSEIGQLQTVRQVVHYIAARAGAAA